jgi:hypothetical protein
VTKSTAAKPAFRYSRFRGSLGVFEAMLQLKAREVAVARGDGITLGREVIIGRATAAMAATGWSRATIYRMVHRLVAANAGYRLVNRHPIAVAVKLQPTKIPASLIFPSKKQ